MDGEEVREGSRDLSEAEIRTMMSSKKKLQVFVSSTYLDLKEERQAAVEAILKAGHIPAGMELFSAGNESQLDTIRRWIDESDVYMLILGGRYGSVHSITSLGYSELEYDYAVSKDKPYFAVVISESSLDAKVKQNGRSVIEGEHAQELRLFRDKVLNRQSSFFNDTKDIKLAVHETLSDFLSRYEFTGWVSGAELAESSALIEELSLLRKKNLALEQEVAEMKKERAKLPKKVGKWEEAELQEIFNLLNAITLGIPETSETDESKKYPLGNIMVAYSDALITGVTNQVSSTGIVGFLYYNVCPKLEIHGLAALEKVPNVRWQRYRLTPKGMALVALVEKRRAKLATSTAITKP
jgi:hypothetical protein